MSEESSTIVKRLKQAGELLLKGASKQVSSYRSRADSLEGVYDRFLGKILRSYTNGKVSLSLVDSFFRKRELKFAAVDGTIYKEPVFDLVVFFAGAYFSKGNVSVASDGRVCVTYDDEFNDCGYGVSSVLPIYVNEVPQVDQTILGRDETGTQDPTVSYHDQWIVDNSAFADYLMGLAEFYLAYRLVSGNSPVDILLMDRVCSSELSSYYAETSEYRMDLTSEAGLIGAKVDGQTFTATDWVYARQLFGNPVLGTPPPRGEYLLPRVIMELMSTRAMTRQEILDRLSLKSEEQKYKLDKDLERGMSNRDPVKRIITRKGEHFSIVPQFKDVVERTERLVLQVAERMFSEDPSVDYETRFKIDGRWITTNDLAFMSLMFLYMTMRMCWKNRVLLVGIAKDTSARDMKRQLLPVLNYTNRFQGSFEDVGADTPDTDRMILQWVSLRERTKLPVPWAVMEYDTAFKTTVPHFNGVSGLISGARRNQVSLNSTFVKSYFQLSEAGSEPNLRSNVLLYDRLVHPGIDDQESTTFVLKHDYGNKPEDPEDVRVVLYDRAENAMQEFIVTVFKSMTSASIPELFGHLKPLYIADKVAKFYYGEFKRVVESTGVWLSRKPELRDFLFYLSTFRERRAEYEQTRRTTE
ncbi:MAG: hypothetical protein HXY34_07555 [Candidatus Thorarchaeota archaeon]|nr:hypothetical protein [Candidatus Thorarchaeota archaeon]